MNFVEPNFRAPIGDAAAHAIAQTSSAMARGGKAPAHAGARLSVGTLRARWPEA
jgi:hypothetical protein